MTYQKYSHEINRQLALHFRDVSEQLAGAATASNSSILSIWNNFLDFLFAHPELSNERSGFLDMVYCFPHVNRCEISKHKCGINVFNDIFFSDGRFS